eukprot:SAG22_NODE_12460_length_442_cov_0.839650_2_plen_65_part_01
MAPISTTPLALSKPADAQLDVQHTNSALQDQAGGHGLEQQQQLARLEREGGEEAPTGQIHRPGWA